MCDSGNFKEYGDFGESPDCCEPRHSGESGNSCESSDTGDSGDSGDPGGSEKSVDSDTFVNWMILVFLMNQVISLIAVNLADLVILVNPVFLLNLSI